MNSILRKFIDGVNTIINKGNRKTLLEDSLLFVKLWKEELISDLFIKGSLSILLCSKHVDRNFR